MRAHATYANEAKVKYCGVKPETLAAFGAVSEQTAFEMASGPSRRKEAARTSPWRRPASQAGRRTKGKSPSAGIVACADRHGVTVERLQLGGGRARVRRLATLKALEHGEPRGDKRVKQEGNMASDKGKKIRKDGHGDSGERRRPARWISRWPALKSNSERARSSAWAARRARYSGDSDGLSGFGYGAGRGRRAARPRGGDLRPGILRQDDRRAAHRRGGAKDGRRAAFIDAEHALDPALCAQAGRGRRSAVRLSRTPASRRWKSARRWFAPARLTSWSSTRWRRSCRRPEIDGEMGDSFVGLQARLMSHALRKLTGIINKTELDLHLHQPASREGRRDVRQSGDAGRPRSSSMRPASTSAAASSSRTAQPSSATARRRRSSRTRSRRRSEPRSSIFSMARASARKAACWTARLRWISSTNPARGSPTATSASVRAARTPASSSMENAEIAAEIDKPRSRRADGQGCARRAERGG